jgi:hypothetical protein
MKYRNRNRKRKGKRKIRVVLYTRKELAIQVIQVIGFITFNTMFLALVGFLSTALALFLNRVEIDLERQKYTFLLVSLGYGVAGFVIGFINSGLALRVLSYIFQVIGCFLRLKDECIIKLIDSYNKIVDRISNRGE